MTLAKAVSMKYNKTIEKCSNEEIYYALLDMTKQMAEDKVSNEGKKKLYYISAEFLIGKLLSNNLINLGIYDSVKSELEASGKNIGEIEEIELEPSLGNGGLGRLAACFVDSIATLGLNGDGVGLNYHYGLFKQVFDHNLQKETPNPWITPDSWLTKTDITYPVQFGGFTVQSRLYNIDVVGYNNRTTKLRLFDIETVDESIVGDTIDFNKDDIAKNLTLFLYPDDSDDKGRLLRVYQQYFMVSNAARLILDEAVEKGSNLHDLADYATVQINDTHPSMVIPELIRLLQERGILMDEAVSIVSKVCAYTNHTILAEALEKWDLKLIDSICPDIARIIINIDKKQQNEGLKDKSVQIIQNGMVNMAYLACYVCKYINGVASLHTELLKSDVLSSFFNLYPQKFQNKTNGITQRRFLRLCNPKYSSLITELLGSDNWIYDLSKLKELEKYAQNKDVLDRFIEIKKENKRELANYIRLRDNDSFSPDFIVDSQIKRLHEYKRQLLNILVILELYFEIKEKTLKDFTPTVFIFGAKSAPGYDRAKGIIKLINEVKRLVEADEYVSRFIKIIFVSDYSVSYAEKIIPASDVSEQISTAGTEASGTGNMKFMLNGAVTLGTYDGANIEIVERAGEENNYIFGARVEDIRKIQNSYNPKSLYENDAKIRRCLDALVDGTLSDNNTGIFEELYNSLLKGASWHKADNYYLLLDFEPFLNEKLKLNLDYKDKYAFAEKCFRNTCAAGYFSSDRTIEEYCNDIWKITKEG